MTRLYCRNNYCDIGPVSMGEFGIYNLQAIRKSTDNNSTACVFEQLREPVNIYYRELISSHEFPFTVK